MRMKMLKSTICRFALFFLIVVPYLVFYYNFPEIVGFITFLVICPFTIKIIAGLPGLEPMGKHRR